MRQHRWGRRTRKLIPDALHLTVTHLQFTTDHLDPALERIRIGDPVRQ